MKKSLQERSLGFLYDTMPGRCILKILVQPWLSTVAGKLLDMPWSKVIIKPFINSNNIDMSEYEKKNYKTYNEFFCRKIRADKRPIANEKDSLISPCDASALVLPIDQELRFKIKRSTYTVERLLRSRKLAARYQEGTAVVLRLDVTDYHRYCYVDNGAVSEVRRIPGVFHTVMPIANDYYPIYHENTREYCMLHSENFGDIIVMEVGALLVGRIVNENERGLVTRGQEKGRFEFGGSTVVLLLEKDQVQWREDLIENSTKGIETAVKMGEVIARK